VQSLLRFAARAFAEHKAAGGGRFGFLRHAVLRKVERLQHAIEDHALRLLVADLERTAAGPQNSDETVLMQVSDVSADVFGAVVVPVIHHDVRRWQAQAFQKRIPLAHGFVEKRHAVNRARACVELGERAFVPVGPDAVLQGRALRHVVAAYQLGCLTGVPAREASSES